MGFNSKKRITGVITEEILNTAIQRDSSHCVVTDALKAQLPQMVRWSADLQTIRFSDPETGKRYVYFTPAICQRLLIDFDNGIKCPIGTEVSIRTPAQIVSRSAKTRDIQRERDRKRKSQTRATVQINGGNRQPTKIGGSTPPLAVLASGTASGRGRRRTFGLRLTDFEYREK